MIEARRSTQHCVRMSRETAAAMTKERCGEGTAPQTLDDAAQGTKVFMNADELCPGLCSNELAANRYTARFMKAVFPPGQGLETVAHRHSGRPQTVVRVAERVFPIADLHSACWKGGIPVPIHGDTLITPGNFQRRVSGRCVVGARWRMGCCVVGGAAGSIDYLGSEL